MTEHRCPRTTLIVAALALAGCAKPSVEQGTSGSSSGGPDDHQQVDDPADDTLGDGDDPRPDALSFELAPPTAGPASCPASKLREVRYASTVDARTKMPAEIGSRRCVDDLWTKLEPDIACAQDYNRASWERALFELELVPFESDPGPVWVDGAQHGMKVGEVVPHPGDPERQLVLIGFDGYDCSGTSVHTTIGPGVGLARRRSGDVVLVVPKPELEARSYASCTCFGGCGARMEATPRFAEVPRGATLAGTVELIYPAISIVSHAVDTTTCCCAP